MALLGPTPAAVIGVSRWRVNGLRSARSPLAASLLVNLVHLRGFPLVGGADRSRRSAAAQLLEASRRLHPARRSGVFLAMNVLNFLLIVVDMAIVDGQPIRRSLRDALRCRSCRSSSPSALLTAGVAFVYAQDRTSPSIGLLAVVGLVFQYLLRTALHSIERKEQLEGRTRELAALQVGLLSTVLQTLSLRDKMTARHSAAVARYSREIARESGSPSRSRTSSTPPALLHDIGKFIFPDSILFADTQADARSSSRSSSATRSRARSSSPASTATARSRRSSSPTTSASTAAATRAGCWRRDPARRADHLRRGHLRRHDRRATPTAGRCLAAEAIAELRRVSGSAARRRVVEIFIGLLEQQLSHLPARRRRRLRARAQLRAPRPRLRGTERPRRLDACPIQPETHGADSGRNDNERLMGARVIRSPGERFVL